MSTEKLQKAISLIKSGDKKNGQDLLVDIVNADPKNETAWLWLVSVVSPDKRIFCLEKVLSINPNNTQAKQYLEKLKSNEHIQSNPISVPPQSTVIKEKEVIPPITEKPVSNLPQYWTVPFGKNLASMIILDNTKLITVDVVPIKIPAILNQLNHGSITKEWNDQNIYGANYKSINLHQILQVRLLLSDININYHDNTMKELSTEITCREDKVSDAIFNSLHQRLGNQFIQTSKPNSRLAVAGRSIISMVITLGIVGLCYWGALDLGTGDVSGRYRGIASLIQLIGPNGILCIGGGLFILLLISMSSQLIKPPMETILARQGSS